MAVAETLDVRVRGAWRAPLLVLAALAGAALLARFLSGSGIGAARTFLLVFGSLLVEALPFILLGAAVSALIEVFVPASVFARLARLPLKGLHPTAAVTFMLAAPILNPVVLLATAIAYRGRDVMWPMLLGRAGLGLVVAMAVGWAVGARARGTELLRPGRRMEEHAHDGAGEGRWSRYFGHLADDFTMLARYLVIGAGIAAALQTFLPQDVIGRVATTPVLDVVALMVLAAALSLCSESDAFVAASFVQFGMASQLAFLVAGPMIDAKLAALYGGTFGRGFVRTVAIVVFAVTLAGSLWIQVAFG